MAQVCCACPPPSAHGAPRYSPALRSQDGADELEVAEGYETGRTLGKGAQSALARRSSRRGAVCLSAQRLNSRTDRTPPRTGSFATVKEATRRSDGHTVTERFRSRGARRGLTWVRCSLLLLVLVLVRSVRCQDHSQVEA